MDYICILYIFIYIFFKWFQKLWLSASSYTGNDFYIRSSYYIDYFLFDETILSCLLAIFNIFSFLANRSMALKNSTGNYFHMHLHNQYQSCFSPLSRAFIYPISSSVSSKSNNSRFSLISEEVSIIREFGSVIHIGIPGGQKHGYFLQPSQCLRIQWNGRYPVYDGIRHTKSNYMFSVKNFSNLSKGI